MFGVGWVHVRRMTEVWRQIARTSLPIAASVAVVALVAAPPTANARKTTIRTPSISTQPKGPLLLVVSIRNQKLHVYDARWRNRIVSRVDRAGWIRHADGSVFRSGKERQPPKQYLFRR